jgi:hypothetical protein
MNYLDLFHGIGGFALGAYWAGMKFENHYCSDIEPYCQKLYAMRFPDSIQLGDITKIDTEKGLVFGLSIGELLTIYDHDSQSWKMSVCLFTGDCERYLEVLPRSGIMQNGRIYEQATWVRRIGEKEYGLWRTPDTCGGGIKSKEFYELCKKTNQSSIRLQDQIKHENFPTPDCSDRRSAKSKQQGLSNYIKNFPTPNARDSSRNTSPKHDRLPDVLGSNSKTGQLNPQWVDWLMGYPVGWTDLKDSEMQLYLK